MGDYGDPPEELVERLRPICLALPDAYEEKAWAGTPARLTGGPFPEVGDRLRDSGRTQPRGNR